MCKIPMANTTTSVEDTKMPYQPKETPTQHPFLEDDELFLRPDGTPLDLEDVERIFRRAHTRLWGSVMWPVFALILVQWFLLTYFVCIPLIDFAFTHLQAPSMTSKAIGMTFMVLNLLSIFFFASDRTLTPFHEERVNFDRALVECHQQVDDFGTFSDLDQAKLAVLLLVEISDLARERCRTLLWEATSRKVIRLLSVLIAMYVLFWLHSIFQATPF